MYNISGFSNQPIIAWHFLTDSDWEEAEESYLSILESGYLTAAAYRENPLLEELDRLAGDDQFLFLSLYPNVTSVYFPERGLEQFPPKVWGFGFDAIELVYGYDAAIRRKDYLHDYGSIKEEIRQQFGADFDDWLEFSDLSKDFQDIFSREARLFQQENQITGSQAVDYLIMVVEDCYRFRTTPLGSLNDREYEEGGRACKFFRDTEIIVPERLPVSDALFIVNDGEMISNDDSFELGFFKF